MLCPAIVTVPERVLVPALAEYVAVTEAAAVPLAGDTLIQLKSLTDAVHAPPLQPLGLPLTVNVVEPPLAGIMATDVGVAEKVQMPDVTNTAPLLAPSETESPGAFVAAVPARLNG
jgi:hypothetical protein